MKSATEATTQEALVSTERGDCNIRGKLGLRIRLYRRCGISPPSFTAGLLYVLHCVKMRERPRAVHAKREARNLPQSGRRRLSPIRGMGGYSPLISLGDLLVQRRNARRKFAASLTPRASAISS